MRSTGKHIRFKHTYMKKIHSIKEPKTSTTEVKDTINHFFETLFMINSLIIMSAIAKETDKMDDYNTRYSLVKSELIKYIAYHNIEVLKGV